MAAPDLNETGLLIDFRLVKKWLNVILDQMDHKHLNELQNFSDINPSAENIAKFICAQMEPKAKEWQVRIADKSMGIRKRGSYLYTGLG